uniref:Caspase 4, apoptosis-related cysteine peptidase n=1 Tax=Jaculus jaculus TaxID=51337 RepID=A0A8C5L4Y4_JACJA
MTENKQPPKPPHKMLEYLGKETIVEFMDKVVKNDVFKLEEHEKEKFFNAERRDKPWILIDSVKGKPNKAGKVLLQSILTLNRNIEPEDRPEEYTDTLKLCPPEEFVRLRTENARNIYPIKEKGIRSRQALIICNTEFDYLSRRDGANFDISGMEGLLKDLGYSVLVKDKLTSKGMESVLQDFAALQEHKSSDSAFVVLMSHGTLHGICGTAHSNKNPDVLHYDTIYQILNNRKCPGLRDKPKVIIVQACRGENSGDLLVRDFSKLQVDSFADSPRNVEADAVRLSHVEKDFITFHSTTPHNKSYRDCTTGSVFITKLIECFKKYSYSCHLEDIFRKVQQSFENPDINAQMPTIDRVTLTRYFYLFPGN